MADVDECSTTAQWEVVTMKRRSVKGYNSQDEYVYAMKEDLAEWFNSLYNLSVNADDFLDHIETGVLLCRHADEVQKYIVDGGGGSTPSSCGQSTAENGTGIGWRVSSRMWQDAQPGSFHSRDNICQFLAWCRGSLGMTDTVLFETDDLVLRKNERNVILCLLEAARQGVRFSFPAPTIIQLEQEIDAELARLKDASVGTCDDFSLPSHTPPRQPLSSAPGQSSQPSREPLPPPRIPSLTSTSSQTVSYSAAETDVDEDDTKRRKNVTFNLMSLDEVVRDRVGRCTCAEKFPMIRVSEGRYRVGESQTMIFVRILRNHVMVRVGGGWDTLENFLDRHDPCRCHGPRGHRLSNGSTPIPVTSSSIPVTSYKSDNRSPESLSPRRTPSITATLVSLSNDDKNTSRTGTMSVTSSRRRSVTTCATTAGTAARSPARRSSSPVFSRTTPCRSADRPEMTSSPRRPSTLSSGARARCRSVEDLSRSSVVGENARSNAADVGGRRGGRPTSPSPRGSADRGRSAERNRPWAAQPSRSRSVGRLPDKIGAGIPARPRTPPTQAVRRSSEDLGNRKPLMMIQRNDTGRHVVTRRDGSNNNSLLNSKQSQPLSAPHTVNRSSVPHRQATVTSGSRPAGAHIRHQENQQSGTPRRQSVTAARQLMTGDKLLPNKLRLRTVRSASTIVPHTATDDGQPPAVDLLRRTSSVNDAQAALTPVFDEIEDSSSAGKSGEFNARCEATPNNSISGTPAVTTSSMVHVVTGSCQPAKMKTSLSINLPRSSSTDATHSYTAHTSSKQSPTSISSTSKPDIDDGLLFKFDSEAEDTAAADGSTSGVDNLVDHDEAPTSAASTSCCSVGSGSKLSDVANADNGRRAATLPASPPSDFKTLIDSLPDPSPTEDAEEINSHMEMLFEEYRKVERGRMDLIWNGDSGATDVDDDDDGGCGEVVSDQDRCAASPATERGRSLSRELPRGTARERRSAGGTTTSQGVQRSRPETQIADASRSSTSNTFTDQYFWRNSKQGTSAPRPLHRRSASLQRLPTTNPTTHSSSAPTNRRVVRPQKNREPDTPRARDLVSVGDDAQSTSDVKYRPVPKLSAAQTVSGIRRASISTTADLLRPRSSATPTPGQSASSAAAGKASAADTGGCRKSRLVTSRSNAAVSESFDRHFSCDVNGVTCTKSMSAKFTDCRKVSASLPLQQSGPAIVNGRKPSGGSVMVAPKAHAAAPSRWRRDRRKDKPPTRIPMPVEMKRRLDAGGCSGNDEEKLKRVDSGVEINNMSTEYTHGSD